MIETFRQKKIPHRVINISNHNDPLNLIELFSYFLLETIILGKVLGLNPYGQPAVQLIKHKIFKKIVLKKKFLINHKFFHQKN